MLYIFDLDGTIINSYMDNPARAFHAWSVLPGRASQITALRAASHTAMLITNQGAVAFGHVSEREVQEKLAAVAGALGYAAVEIHDGSGELMEVAAPGMGRGVLTAFVAYGDSRSRDPRYQDGSRRKPSGAMLREALAWDARDGYPQQDRPGGVLFVGDRPEDAAAAADADVSFRWTEEFFNTASTPA